MTHALAMLDTHPQASDIDAGMIAITIDVLADCANTCTQCADACLSETDPADLARCIRLNLDCADICATTSRVVSRLAPGEATVLARLLETCAAACRACGDECSGHAAQMQHCAICAEQCQRCERACRALLDTIT